MPPEPFLYLRIYCNNISQIETELYFQGFTIFGKSPA